MTREELIEQGKMNEWVAFGGLSKELQELMRELWESEEIEYRGEINWRNKGKTVELYKTTIYRINPNYTEQPKESKYDVFDVKVDNGGDYYYTDKYGDKCLLFYQICNNRFAGLQFEGQSDLNEWLMTMAAINNKGYILESCDNDYIPATPNKIRIIKTN